MAYEEFDFSSTDFGFGLSDGHLQVPADLLFDGGKIRPLKLLPRSEFQCNIYQSTYSPRSPRSPKRMLSKGGVPAPPFETKEEPILVNQTSKDVTSSSPSILTSSGSSSSSIWSRRWKLTDLFTSLGSSTDKNVTNKDDSISASILRSHKKDSNEWSFRSESSSGKSGSSRGGGGRRRGRVSAHEWHYKQNRAAAEEMRRKTFLPYKKSLLGCMDVDMSGVVDFSRGHGSVEITC